MAALEYTCTQFLNSNDLPFCTPLTMLRQKAPLYLFFFIKTFKIECAQWVFTFTNVEQGTTPPPTKQSHFGEMSKDIILRVMIIRHSKLRKFNSQSLTVFIYVFSVFFQNQSQPSIIFGLLYSHCQIHKEVFIMFGNKYTSYCFFVFSSVTYLGRPTTLVYCDKIVPAKKSLFLEILRINLVYYTIF